MPYVTVPQDISKVKTKVLFGLTLRQLVCFAAGLAAGLPLFFLTKDTLGNSNAISIMVAAMLPAFLMAMYEKNGQPLETVLRSIIRSRLLRPKLRKYTTDNLYAVLERQMRLNEEVERIADRKETFAGRKKNDPEGNRKGKKNR